MSVILINIKKDFSNDLVNTIMCEVMDIVSDVEIDDKFVFGEFDNKEVAVLFFNPFENIQILNIFVKHNIVISHRDITNDILLENFIGNSEFESIFNNKDFKNVLNEYLKDNKSINDVLDKLNNVGIENLSELDMSILNNG